MPIWPTFFGVRDIVASGLRDGARLDTRARARLDRDADFARDFWQLRGKRLICFCRPKDGFGEKLLCHGQIMAKILDGEVIAEATNETASSWVQTS